MSFKARSEDIDELCSIFNNKPDDTIGICKWMSKEFSQDPFEEVDGFQISSPHIILIMGARKLFRVYAYDKLKAISNHPLLHIAETRISSKILSIENATFHSRFRVFRQDFSNKFNGTNLSITEDFGSGLINQSRNAKQSLDLFMQKLILNDESELFIQTQTGLSKNHVDFIRFYIPDFQFEIIDSIPTEAEFITKWNGIIASILHNEIVRQVEDVANRPKDVISLSGETKEFLDGVSFHLFELKDIQDTMIFLKDIMQYVIFKRLSTKFIAAKNPDRRRLTDNEIANSLSAIQYSGSFVGITDIAEKRVRLGLLKDLKKIEMEPQFLPHLRVRIVDKFRRAFIPVNHPVGLIAAQALGENASQAGLRSFHHAGISGDTGFDRILAVTNMTSVKSSERSSFTSIALQGNPSRKQAQMFANLIEETKVGDVCKLIIGRTRDDVPDMHGIFKGTPVFKAEENGWQNIYIKTLIALGLKSETITTRGFILERPDWIIHMVCDQNRMYQRRISMADIAKTIEHVNSNLRVIISDISTGLIEIYFYGDPFSISGDKSDQRYHTTFTKIIVPDTEQILIQGQEGFKKAIVERYSINRFIIDVFVHKEKGFIVNFSTQEVALNGVPEEQIESFLSIKAGVNKSQIKNIGDNIYHIVGSKFQLKAFKNRLTSEETVKLIDAVESANFKNKDEGLITLDRNKLRNQEEVNVESIVAFFSSQNVLRQFDSVNISFNRKDFNITITTADTFSPLLVLGILKDIDRNLEEKEVILGEDTNTITFPNFPSEGSVHAFEYLSKAYGTTFNIKIIKKENDFVDIIATITPLTPEQAWNKLTIVETVCEDIPTTFTSNAREKFAHRYRILARGVGTMRLSTLHFINIYATIPSVAMEIFNIFDIEATRAYVQSELVLNGSKEVGDRHLSMVADALTYMGQPVKLKLSGKQAMKAGVLSTASMQETLNITLDASAGGVADDLRSAVGMTMIGDFNRGAQSKESLERRETDLDSAIDLLKVSTATMKSRRVTVKKTESKPRVVIRASSSISDDAIINNKKYQPEEGFL